MGGLPLHHRHPDSPPARVGVSIGDTLASLHGVIGALMSLLRVKTGQGGGQVVDVSLVESVFNVMESLVPEYDLLGEVRDPHRRRAAGHQPVEHLSDRDGAYVVIAGNSDPIFRRLMEVIGRPDLADDPALAQQRRPRAAATPMLERPSRDWTAQRNDRRGRSRALDAADVPAGRIYSVADIVADPHYAARDMILPTELPGGVTVKMPGIVPKLSETPGAVQLAGPDAGPAHRRGAGRPRPDAGRHRAPAPAAERCNDGDAPIS